MRRRRVGLLRNSFRSPPITNPRELFHERRVKLEELTYRAHGFFTGRELYFLDLSGNLLEVRDPTWTAGIAHPVARGHRRRRHPALLGRPREASARTPVREVDYGRRAGPPTRKGGRRC